MVKRHRYIGWPGEETIDAWGRSSSSSLPIDRLLIYVAKITRWSGFVWVVVVVKLFVFRAILGIALSVLALAPSARAMVVSGAGVETFGSGPTTPGKWGSPVFGTGATVTWSLMETGVSCGTECSGGTFTHLRDFMPSGFESEIISAFAAWSLVADITFAQVTDSGHAFNAAGATGDIRIGGHSFDGPNGTLAHGYYPPNNGDSAAGDIHFDTADSWTIGFEGPGFDIFQVTAHEIGHAIGLGHTNVAGSLMNKYYNEAYSGPQADDIAGARFIYGTPAVVPLPAALPLLGSALLMMGMIGWRKRRMVGSEPRV